MTDFPTLGLHAISQKWRQVRLERAAGAKGVSVKEMRQCWDQQTSLDRDDRLTESDVKSAKERCVNILHKLMVREVDSGLAWVRENPEHVLYLQEQVVDEDGNVSVPFVLILGSNWQMQKLIDHGHDRDLQMDSTFGTNVHKSVAPPPPYAAQCDMVSLTDRHPPGAGTPSQLSW